ncbi:MAG TPA: AAA family ATPase, partial [Ktedonobacterales bacterium]
SDALMRAFGRDAEIEQVTRSLLSRQSVLLLGAAEVGKTAILHELINRSVWKQGPAELHTKRVVSISTGGILAGTEYLGDWQTRLTDLLEAIKQDGDIFLYIEDIWGLRDAGRASDKADGFSTLIRPYLERQDVTIIGESTPENYASGGDRRRGLADEPSLMKCFNIIRIEETSVEVTKRILLAVARHLQRTHKVRIEATALERGLELTRRFLPYQAFPGKAVRLLEETARTLGAQAPQGQRPAGGEVVIGADAVSAGFSRITGLPEKIISDRIPLTQDEIRTYFDERVIGQDEAITAVLDVVTLIKAELHDPNRPLGVLFFVGPTGVGKTELAKTLAEYLFGSKDKLLRFDMSEFKTYASLDDLLEQLTEKQRQQSFSVLLLDEIEKAGPFVFDLFLSAFDDARLTDASGRSVDLHNTIIVMTSNLGSDLEQAHAGHAMGFVDEPDAAKSAADKRRDTLVAVVKGHFRPEFINRLDKIVTFQPLGMDAMRRIARRELGKALLREGVLRRNILLDFRDEVVDVLLAAGFSPTYGARPLQRAIKEEVLLPLARKIAAQPSVGEQLLELCVRDGRIESQILPAETQPAEQDPSIVRERSGEHDTGREHAKDLRQLRADLELLQERVDAHIDSERYHALQAQVEGLLKEVGQPAFWDDQERSRQTLSTIYRLEQVTDHFTDLRNRIEGLLEMAGMIHLHGDPAGPRELASKYEALAGDVLLAELELVAGDEDTDAADAAFICITPLSVPRARDATEWAEALGAMYLAWARRKGYDAESVNETSAAPVLVIRGPNVHRMLHGENGVHKLHRDVDMPDSLRGKARGVGRSHIQYARVEVLPSRRAAPGIQPVADETIRVALIDVEGGQAVGSAQPIAEAVIDDMGLQVRIQAADASQLAASLLRARAARRPKGALLTADDELARVYYLTRSQHVRDPRTERRLSRPHAVLAGEIDPFLLAWLSARRADATTNAARDPTGGSGTPAARGN